MSSEIIANRKIYNYKQNQVRFSYVLCKTLTDYIRDKRIPHKSTHYRLLTKLRKKLGLKGKSYEKIDLEVRDEFPYIPDFLFEEKTKEQRIKTYQDYVKNAKLPE